MEAMHPSSEEAFTRILSELNVPFHDWGKIGTTKPKEFLYQKYEDSEADFFVDAGSFVTHTRKASVRLLRRRPHGLEYLAQRKIFWNGETIKPSKSISVRGHRRARLGEDSLTTVIREVAEELDRPDALKALERNRFLVRYANRDSPLTDSQSYPGTKRCGCDCSFQMMFPEGLQQDRYEEVVAFARGAFSWPGYRAVSKWKPITAKIAGELTEPVMQALAA
jgi:ribosomal 50S subunit-recycling heat shock protein